MIYPMKCFTMANQLRTDIKMKLQKQLIGVILLLLTLSIEVKTQNINEFYFEVNMARKLARDGKTDSAIASYENAFKKVDYVQITYLKKVLNLAKLNEDEARINKYTQQIKKQTKGTSPKLMAIVDSLIIVDQKVRTGKSARKSRYAAKCDYKNKGNRVSKRYKKSKKAMENWLKTDSLNTHYLLTLFKKHGFFGEELVGRKRYVEVIVMLYHYDQDTNNTILEPVLEKARKQGRIGLSDYAEILDRHLGGKYTIQKYWMWPYVGKEKLQFSEADIPKIIKLRESIGVYDLGLRQEKIKYGNWRLINYYL